jgi:hypothetical protein
MQLLYLRSCLIGNHPVWLAPGEPTCLVGGLQAELEAAGAFIRETRMRVSMHLNDERFLELISKAEG